MIPFDKVAICFKVHCEKGLLRSVASFGPILMLNLLFSFVVIKYKCIDERRISNMNLKFFFLNFLPFSVVHIYHHRQNNRKEHELIQTSPITDFIKIQCINILIFQ